MTPETLRRVAAIAQAHPKGQGARSGLVVSNDAYRAIEDARDVSPQTAQRWVKRAERRAASCEHSKAPRQPRGQHSGQAG